MLDWQPYLISVSRNYEKWWESYTITDVAGKISPRQQQGMLLDLMVSEVKSDRENRQERQEITEILDILTGLRKYSLEIDNHVLLQGKPGSGKSTALARLLLEQATNILENQKPIFQLRSIPVLVQLRYYKTSILDLIDKFLREHEISLGETQIKNLLLEKQFFLLIDGINELPSNEATTDLKLFRKTYKNVPMVFTTRELGLRGDLEIEKKLAMQSLSEPQMRDFVKGYLGNEGENLLKQLGNERLKRLGETPLLLLMLCSIYANNQRELPKNLGETFRAFTKLHDEKLKADVTTQCNSIKLWADSLQYLAFTMTECKNEPAISQTEAEAIIGEFLTKNNEENSLTRKRLWLEDLINHHLLQRKGEDEIEFHHQLIQEYYAAEYLLGYLSPSTPLQKGYLSPSTPLWKEYLSPPTPLWKGGEYRVSGGEYRVSGGEYREYGVSDEELQRHYLNYLKWTETIALMLGLVKDEGQAVRIVKLALEVDWQLGARLAGEVRKPFQAKTVQLIFDLNLPHVLIVRLLNLTRSDVAIPHLIKALENSNDDVRRHAAYALGKIGTEGAIPGLIKALEDSNDDVRTIASYALINIGTETAIPGLIKALEDSDYYVRWNAAEALGKIDSERAIAVLIKALEYSDNLVLYRAAFALSKIDSERAIPYLIKALEYSNDDVRSSAAFALGEIGSERAIPYLIKALEYSDYAVRSSVAEALGNIGSERAIPALINALEDSDDYVRSSVAWALGKIGSERAIPGLIKALEDSDYAVRSSVAGALGEIGSERAIPALINALENSDYAVRGNAAYALGKIRTERAISALIKALEDSDYNVRSNAAEALGEIGTERAITALIKALEDSDDYVRSSVAGALGKIGSERAITALIKALEDSNDNVRRYAAYALGKIGSERAIPGLIKALEALEDSDNSVRSNAAEALGEIGTERAIPGLIKALEDSKSYVRRSAAEALVKIGTIKALWQLKQLCKNPEFLLINDSNTAIKTLETIQTIQESDNCKIYNPEFIMNMNPSEIFISYAWGGESEQLTNQLETAFQARNITIIRDKNELEYKGLIKEFMQRIGQGKCVILVISDKYLKSKNCMFELVEIAKNGDFYDRIFPIVLKDANIYDAIVRDDYTDYWDQKIEELNQKIKARTGNLGKRESIFKELDLYTEIRHHIDQLANTIQNMNTLTPETHIQSNFDAIIKAVSDKLS